MKKYGSLLIALLIAIVCYAQDKPQGLRVNDTAPLFTAKDQSGKTVNLKSLLKKGPVVMMFYRGEWCPFCNKQLTEMQDSLMMVTSKGATVVAITPEKPENILKTIEKTKASFPVLFDDGLKIMKDYKVAFAVAPTMIEKYKEYGIDFSVVNGDNGANLPVPAVYIISKEGKIIYRYFDENYRKRLSVRELVKRL
jgi:peroxiredoxin